MKDKNIVVKVVVGLFAIFGFVFIIVGISWAVSADSFMKNAVEVSAVISDQENLCQILDCTLVPSYLLEWVLFLQLRECFL